MTLLKTNNKRHAALAQFWKASSVSGLSIWIDFITVDQVVDLCVGNGHELLDVSQSAQTVDPRERSGWCW